MKFNAARNVRGEWVCCDCGEFEAGCVCEVGYEERARERYSERIGRRTIG